MSCCRFGDGAEVWSARGSLVFDPVIGSCGVVLDDAMGVLCEFLQLPERP